MSPRRDRSTHSATGDQTASSGRGHLSVRGARQRRAACRRRRGCGSSPSRGSQQATALVGSIGFGRPASSIVIRNHFCPLVSRDESNYNRARRMRCNKIKVAARQDAIFREPFTEPVVSFPEEYVNVLKARYTNRSYYGGPDYVCEHCSAIFWFNERIESRSSRQQIIYNLCCRGGRVSLPKRRLPPSPLRELISFNGGPQCNEFMRLIRQYNSLFAFTSLGVHIDRSVNSGGGPYVFRINGVVHHRIGSLIPPVGKRPEYAQLYIHDTSNELQNRLNIFSRECGEGPDPQIVDALIDMLNQNNPLVRQFRMARDKLLTPPAPDISIKIAGTIDNHGDRYSLPTTSELAGLLIDCLSTKVSAFDVIVKARTPQVKHVSHIHPALMALQYPLLFPYGDIGFHIGIKYKVVDSEPVEGRDEVSMLEFYAYYMHYRIGEPNPELCSGRLSQQFEVNAYSCVESNKLEFQFFNQDLLRCERYQGISDAVGQGASTGRDVGIKKMLPASHIGSRRYMQQNYYDCLAICSAYGPLDKFTTFTCNSKWPEIAEAIRFEPGQKPTDRADMVVRVFHMKLEEYLTDIKEGRVFGPVRAVVHTNEFQKRGLPHAHILAWQSDCGREPSAEDVDQYISAELPYPEIDPLGFSLVQEFMIHGPCGLANPNSPCMKDGKCSKRYPKPFRVETSFDPDGYPLYRRRDNGSVVWKNNVQLDNRWVVPHNLDVLKKYQAHINVEACNKTYLIKYLFKHINKGFNCGGAGFSKGHARGSSEDVSRQQTGDQEDPNDGGVDEIADYMKSRYLSCCEATWRLFGFEIHGKFPSVQRLFVHLPGMNFVTLHENADLHTVVNDPESEKSSLTEWFSANSNCTRGHHLTYCQFPSMFTWDKDSKVWNLRKRGVKLGRLRYVHPRTGETFYLRMLLMVVKGAKSYEDVRTYEGVLYATFREACQARGLIGYDTEWAFVFDEAIVWATAYQLRKLFVTILVYCDVGNVRALFNKYWRYMAHDIAYRLCKAPRDPSYVVPESMLQSGLMNELNNMLCSNGLSIASYDLPNLEATSGDGGGNRLIFEEMCYDKVALRADSTRMSAMLNCEQRKIYDAVVNYVSQGQSFCYFVSGHGGTGKTFLWNAILATLRSHGHVVLAVASCGVASLLLPGGRTAHSRFRIPLEIHENSLCGIGRGTMLAGLISRASLVIWDEAPMTHRHCFEALDRTFRDILSLDDSSNSTKPFGGKPMLFGGDFRQVLPVIEGGDRTEILESSLLGSHLLSHVKIMRLSINMRLCNPLLPSEEKIDMEKFAKWVLDIGEGKIKATSRNNEREKNWIHIPQEFLLMPPGPKIPAIADAIYDDFLLSYASVPYLTQRCIVCPVNTVVDEVNNFMIDRVPGCVREYLSFDTIANSSEQPSDFEALYPPEFLNSLAMNNFSQHRLALKVGIPVVLLRNINQSIGLCNGTRLLIERLGDRVLEGRIMTGNHVGDMVCIPRIFLNGTSPKWPFTLKRRQFPVKVCYAMTINKCQGQTLEKVGVYLREPVFTHGQLYVAVSRVNSKHGLKMLIEDEDGEPSSATRNIVFEEVLKHV